MNSPLDVILISFLRVLFPVIISCAICSTPQRWGWIHLIYQEGDLFKTQLNECPIKLLPELRVIVCDPSPCLQGDNHMQEEIQHYFIGKTPGAGFMLQHLVRGD